MVEEGGIGCGTEYLCACYREAVVILGWTAAASAAASSLEFWRASGPNLVVELMPTEVLLSNEGRAWRLEGLRAVWGGRQNDAVVEHQTRNLSSSSSLQQQHNHQPP
jgi:hypothetical protein